MGRATLFLGRRALYVALYAFGRSFDPLFSLERGNDRHRPDPVGTPLSFSRVVIHLPVEHPLREPLLSARRANRRRRVASGKELIHLESFAARD